MTWTGMLLGFLAVTIVGRWLLICGEKARS